MTRRITVTEAARTFADVVNRVLYRHESAILIRGGKPVARIVPVEASISSTGRELAAAWASLPHLSLAEAESFESDIQRSKEQLPPLVGAWE